MSITEAVLAEAQARLGLNIAAQIKTEFDALRANLEQPPEPAPKIRFANHRYWGQGPAPAADLYEIQHLTADLTVEPYLSSETYRHVSTQKNPANPAGTIQFLPPAMVPDSWLLKKTDGTTFYREQNDGEYLVNPGNTGWRSAINANLKTLIGAYDGLYVDEVDLKTPFWGYPGPGSYDLRVWEEDLTVFVELLGDRCRSLGKKLWVNLGADYNPDSPTQNRVIRAVDGVNIEFFVARAGVNKGPAYGLEWDLQVNFLDHVERAGKKELHAHASGVYSPYVDYAFASWLLGTWFRGSFSASLDYGGALTMPSATLLGQARNLGQPLESCRPVNGLVTRKFQNGQLTLNRTGAAVQGYAPRAWTIVP